MAKRLGQCTTSRLYQRRCRNRHYQCGWEREQRASRKCNIWSRELDLFAGFLRRCRFGCTDPLGDLMPSSQSSQSRGLLRAPAVDAVCVTLLLISGLAMISSLRPLHSDLIARLPSEKGRHRFGGERQGLALQRDLDNGDPYISPPPPPAPERFQRL